MRKKFNINTKISDNDFLSAMTFLNKLNTVKQQINRIQKYNAGFFITI